MGGDLLHIRVRHDAGTQMAVISGLLKIHVPQIFHHTLRQDKQGCKHDRCQNNGKDGNQIARFVCLETAVCQCAYH